MNGKLVQTMAQLATALTERDAAEPMLIRTLKDAVDAIGDHVAKVAAAEAKLKKKGPLCKKALDEIGQINKLRLQLKKTAEELEDADPYAP